MRYSGKIGFVITEEQFITVDGVRKSTGKWMETVVERHKTGDVLKNTYRSNGTDKVNNDLTIGNQLSVIGNEYDFVNSHCIKYAEFLGTMWCVTNVDIQFPRLILTLGGVYNGEQA